MTDAPTTSAIIPFYGDPQETFPLIAALQQQQLYEIIVVDDCSPVAFPPTEGIIVKRRSENGGFGSAVNTGAAQATGDYLLVLNSDLDIGPGFVADLTHAAAPWQPAVVSPAVREGGKLAATAKSWPSIRTAFFSWLTSLARLRSGRVWNSLVGHRDTSREPRGGVRVDWVVGACMLIPADGFRRVGGLDERFFMNSEEIDLQRRLCNVGVPAVLLPSVEVGHIGGGSSDPARRRQWLVDGLFIYFAKWGGARRLAVSLCLASALNFVWNLGRQLRGVKVDACDAFRHEISLIRHGFNHRAGRS